MKKLPDKPTLADLAWAAVARANARLRDVKADRKAKAARGPGIPAMLAGRLTNHRAARFARWRDLHDIAVGLADLAGIPGPTPDTA